MLAFLRATVRKQRLNALPVSLSSNTIRSFAWPPHHSAALELDFSSTAGAVSQEKECSRKRQRNASCGRAETKACREKLRREKLSDKWWSRVLGLVENMRFARNRLMENFLWTVGTTF